MAHTGSVRDNWDVMEQWYAADRDPPIALGVAMERYLSPTGADYHASGNFFSYAPGTQWNYSNVGIALAAYLLERHTGAELWVTHSGGEQGVATLVLPRPPPSAVGPRRCRSASALVPGRSSIESA